MATAEGYAAFMKAYLARRRGVWVVRMVREITHPTRNGGGALCDGHKIGVEIGHARL